MNKIDQENFKFYPVKFSIFHHNAPLINDRHAVRQSKF